MDKNNGKAIKLGISSVVVMCIVGTMGYLLPVVGILIYPAAVLFFICSKKYGFIFTLPFLTAAYVFVAFGSSFSTSIADVLAPGLAAIVMGELMRLNTGQGECLVKGIITAILCNLSSIICIRFLEGQSLLKELRKNVNITLDAAVEADTMTIHTAQLMRQTYEIILQMVPAMLIITILIGTVFVYFAGCVIMKRRGEELSNYYPFWKFSFSRNIIYGALIMLALGYLAGLIGLVGTNVLLLNISIVILMLFSIQGLAVAAYLWGYFKFPRIIFIVMAALLFMSLIGTSVLFFLGVADIVLNIRGRMDAKRGQ